MNDTADRHSGSKYVGSIIDSHRAYVSGEDIKYSRRSCCFVMIAIAFAWLVVCTTYTGNVHCANNHVQLVTRSVSVGMWSLSDHPSNTLCHPSKKVEAD